jgi:hypothetical protein
MVVWRKTPSGGAPKGRSAESKTGDPAVFFQRGQQALKENRLEEAAVDFREVLQMDPKVGPEIWVGYMRGKQWAKALQALIEAKELMPECAGDPAEYRARVLPAE